MKYVQPRPVEDLIPRMKLEQQYIQSHPVRIPKSISDHSVDGVRMLRDMTHRRNIKAIEWAKKEMRKLKRAEAKS